MSSFLHRIGRLSVRRSRAVILTWLVLLALGGGAAAAFGGATSNSFSIPGTESFDALDRVGAAFPGADGAVGQVVLAADSPLSSAGQRATVQRLVTGLGGVPGVVNVADPFTAGAVSADGRVARIDVQFSEPLADIAKPSLRQVDVLAEQARSTGLQVELGGEALTEETEVGHLGEILGLSVAVVVLVVTLGSLVAAGLPLVTALVGVGVGLAGLTALSGSVELNNNAPVLALMIGLAVGIDYALFVLARYRQELAAGLERDAAVLRAARTAGSAVVFAGGTVVIALAGLSVVGIPFLTQMGLAASATVALAVLVALTLVPALLSALGPRIDAGRLGRAPRMAAPAGHRSRWVRAVVRRPVLTLVAAIGALGVLALPVADLELGLPGAESRSTSDSARRAYDLVSENFGVGANGPLLLVVEGGPPAAAAFADTVRALPDVSAVSPPMLDAKQTTALLQVVPGTAPTDPRTVDLVHDIRDAAEKSEVRAAVTGVSAINIDTSEKLADALPIYIALIMGLASVLLLLVFRSVLVAVKAIAGFLLTIAAAGGVVVAVFQKGWGAGFFGVDVEGPIISFLPLFMIGVVFGLAMDYQVFLVSRMRERYQHGESARDAVERGFTDSARVVTSAAVIMIAVFGGFILTDDPVIKSIGLALAVGVAVDAFVVRMTIVPAVMALLGDRAWRLPAWLDRLLPHIDVEGETAEAEERPAPVLAS